MIDFAAWILLLPPALTTLILLVELIAAQLRPRGGLSGGLPDKVSPRIAILIPAHDEADCIAGTVARIRDAMPTGTRLLVVADNCADRTAEIARLEGAEVIERRDPDRIGKGHALACGRDHLTADSPDIVLIVDADCEIDTAAISGLAAAAMASGRPVQSTYVLRGRPDRGVLPAISGFAFLIRNLVRQRGLARMGAPTLLTGSGMAFPWHLLAEAPLATDDLVEDLALGIWLSRAGKPPVYLADAWTWSDGAGRRGLFAQRVRWEQGFLHTPGSWTAALIFGGSWPLRWLGLHLLVPPLALLCALDAAVIGLLAMFAALGATALPLWLLTMLTLLLAIMLLVSWARFGRAQVTAAQLLLAPAYILWKLPIYALALFRPERRWVRTPRD